MRASHVTSERPRLNRAAFTLVELLVSMTVLLIIVVMLSSLLNSTLRIFSSSESSQERHRSGRALTDFIGRELRAALLPAQIAIASDSKQANLQLVIDPSQIATSDSSGGPAYLNADAIFWQAPLATETTFGDIAEVGYFVKWIPNGSTLTPTLCRFFVNPSTGSAGSVSQNPDFLVYTNPASPLGTDSSSGWLTSALLAKVAPADKANGYVGLFAENVLGMWVQSYGTNGVELSPNHSNYDSRVGYQLQTGQSNNKPEIRYLPALIRVSIAQIDASYAGRLGPSVNAVRASAASAVNATDFYNKLSSSGVGSINALLPGIRVYSTDVTLDNGR